MGFYINPKNESKEEWLQENAKRITISEAYEKQDDEVPVVLIDNGAFRAAGIAYSKDEYKDFTQIHDRPFKTYLVKKNLLPEVSDIIERFYTW